MAGYLSSASLIIQVFTDAGLVGNGYKLYTYDAGTTTPRTTYTTSSLGVANANPLVLSSTGRPTSEMWTAAGISLKVVITDAAGAPIANGTFDNLPALNDPTAVTFSSIGGFARTADEISAGITPTDYTYPEGHVHRYGAVGDGSTYDAVAIQTAFTLGKSVTFMPLKTYSISTTTINFTKNNTVVWGNGATLTYTGSTYAVDFTPLSNIYLQGCQVNELFIVASAAGATCWRLRCSYSTFINCAANPSSASGAATAYYLYTDITNGTGPYYNTFVNCIAAGSASSTTNYGWRPFLDATAKTRGPNANQWVGGRTSTFNFPWKIAGAGNVMTGVVVEATKSGGYIFDFTNENMDALSAGCINNVIFGAYVEGLSGANFVRFSNWTSQCRVVFPYVTSLGAGTYLTDSSNNITNMIEDEKGYSFQNSGSTAYNTLDWYDENANAGTSNGWTPALAGSSTAGTQTYSTRVARYTRIGNLCWVTGTMVMSAKDGTTAGNMRVTGLPFTVKGVSNSFGCMAIGGIRVDNSAGYTWTSLRAVPGTTYMELIENGDNVAPQALPAAGLTATSEIEFSGIFEI